MHKPFRRAALVALSAVFVAGQTITAFAGYKDDVNDGPGVKKEVSQEAPDGSSAGETPVQSGDTETSASGSQEQAAAGQPAQEQPQENPVPANQAYLQIQLMRPDVTWTDPIVDDTVISVGEGGFLSMCIYTNNLPGDVLYRTYASARGWSRWAMNGGHSDWQEGCPVEAVQIRLNGVFGDRFDIYYTSTLSDGTQCGWSKAGGTNGAMASGKIITGLRLSMWGKNTGTPPHDMNNPLVAASADGVQSVDGMPYYSNGTGEPYTGWGWNDRDRYYFVDNAPVTGWQYIDGYKYFFEADGRLVSDLEPYLNAAGPFMLNINKQMNAATVFIQDGANGFIIPYKTFLCSTGDDTPIGTFKTPEKHRWRLMNTGEYCQYCTRLGSGLSILLHSVIYSSPNPYTLKPATYNWLGFNRSHGCIRFTTADAKWIFDYCPVGTTINVYESPVPGPFDRAAIKTVIPDTQNYDPTDVSVPENGLQ